MQPSPKRMLCYEHKLYAKVIQNPIEEKKKCIFHKIEHILFSRCCLQEPTMQKQIATLPLFEELGQVHRRQILYKAVQELLQLLLFCMHPHH
jgi:hypothetical protein